MYVGAILKIKHSLNRSLLISKDGWEEIKIPISSGFKSEKWRRAQDKRPILLLQGLHASGKPIIFAELVKDNCGTFDRLIPMLRQDRGYLAIDFPGHGLSSNFPLGMSYYWIDYTITVRRIVQYFKWPKVSILGHSVGGASGYYYDVIFPNEVDFLISIDALKPITADISVDSLGQRIDNLIKYDHLLSLHREGPAYTMEELKKVLHEGSDKSIDLDVCEFILKRNVKESSTSPSKYYFTRDLRLKELPLLNIQHDQIIKNTSKLICPTLYFQSSNKIKKFVRLTNTEEIVGILQETKKNFERHVVEGTHHVHLNNPERLAGYINDFLVKYDVQ
ncbi:hypothetical protein FQA39_LY01219 [Lamprigera yunnana]|nr:hypothetical protein FQA39_LY01219 [Lamprigera yunnana]